MSLGRFAYTEPPRSTVKKGKAGLQGRVGAVLPHRTSSNHCDEGGCRLTGKVRVSSGRFDPTDASPFSTVVRVGSVWSNRPELTRTFPVGLLPHLSQWFEEVRCSRTTPTLLEPSLSACLPFRHSGPRRFGVVDLPRAHSNLPFTHSTLPFRPASPFSTVVRVGSVWSNRPELTRTFPVGLLPHLSQWFDEFGAVRSLHTSSNHC